MSAQEREAGYLFGRAQKCRQLARGIADLRTRSTLTVMAADYETRARRIQEHAKAAKGEE